MVAIRISCKLESTTPHLPELAPLLGKRVQFFVSEAPNENVPSAADANWVNPLRGSVVRDDDPFGPAISAEEWEANR